MKTITFFLLSVLIISVANAQEKGVIKIYIEGGQFQPKEVYSYPVKNGFMTGIGLAYEFPVLKKLYGSLGIGYRYQYNQKYQVETTYQTPSDEYYYTGYTIKGSNGSFYYPFDFSGQWQGFPQHYLVVPLSLKYRFWRSFFVEAGGEANWLLNYDQVTEKPVYNWSVGVGSRLGDLEWSLNYLQATKRQSMVNWESNMGQTSEELKYQEFKGRMLMLNLSYPLWKR